MFYCKVIAAALVSSLLFASYASAQRGPSFNCRTDRGRAEQAICGDDGLRQMDLAMASLYFAIQSDNAGRKYRRLQKEQVEWLKDRNECGSNARCLRRIYRDRIRELADALDVE